MALKPALNQFNGGEISPWLEGRFDWDKYNYSAKLCKNFIPLIEGSLKRRGGSHFVYSPNTFISCKVVFKIISNTPPTLTVNGNIIELSQVDNQWVSAELFFNKNSEIEYIVLADGYWTQYDNIVLSQDKIVEITMEVGEMMSMDILRFSDDVMVEVNGIKVENKADIPTSPTAAQQNKFRVLIRYKEQILDFRYSRTTGTLATAPHLALIIYSIDNKIVYGFDFYNNIIHQEIGYFDSPVAGESKVYSFPDKMKLEAELIGAGGGMIETSEGLYGGGGGAYLKGKLQINKGEKFIVSCGAAGKNEAYEDKGGDSSIVNIANTLYMKALGGKTNWPTEKQGVGGGYIFSDGIEVLSSAGGSGDGTGSGYYGWGAQKTAEGKSGNGYCSLRGYVMWESI